MPPPKAHRSATGLTRNSRSTSGGTSKVGLNLHFTQKDPTQAVKKTKGINGHRHEVRFLLLFINFPKLTTPSLPPGMRHTSSARTAICVLRPNYRPNKQQPTTCPEPSPTRLSAQPRPNQTLLSHRTRITKKTTNGCPALVDP